MTMMRKHTPFALHVPLETRLRLFRLETERRPLMYQCRLCGDVRDPGGMVHHDLCDRCNDEVAALKRSCGFTA